MMNAARKRDEYNLVLIAVALGLALTGAGAYSIGSV